MDTVLRLSRALTQISACEKALSAKVPEQQPMPALRPLFETEKTTLSSLRIAAVMDEFTYTCYAPECQLLQLSPNGFKEEIESFQPDLVFIESAWQGKNKQWERKISNGSRELSALAAFVKSKHIPLVFWNKEDPVHTASFLPAARLADYVFTTDIDCIEIYRRALGHDRVFFLHFAAQPALHNPIERFDRQDKFCFAGAYYHRYPERVRVFDAFASYFMATKGLDIYDRNYPDPPPQFAFPPQYAPHILGKLAPTEIDKAYKGYTYGVNMNSVRQSQTMMARRVFEMLASNTIVIGNYARGVKNLFGDLTICTDDERTMQQALETYTGSERALHGFRLQGLRKVLSHHLYQDRLSYICQKVFGKPLTCGLPPITVVAKANDREQAVKIVAMFRSQNYQNRRLLLCAEQGWVSPLDSETVLDREVFASALETHMQTGFAACFDPNDAYGANYLTDLALSTRYTDANVIGKAAFFTADGFINGPVYRFINAVSGRRCIVRFALCKHLSMADFCAERVWENALAVDEFSYAENCTVLPERAVPMPVLDTGISQSQLVAVSERRAAKQAGGFGLRLAPAAFGAYNESKKLAITAEPHQLVIESKLKEKEQESLWFTPVYETNALAFSGTLPVHLSLSGSGRPAGLVRFLDAAGQEISSLPVSCNRVQLLLVPPCAKTLQLGLRVTGPGRILFSRALFGAACSEPETNRFLPRAETLIVSNRYPSYQELYRNMFVHKRVQRYKAAGLLADVMAVDPKNNFSFDEFEGINVCRGDAAHLSAALSSGVVRSVAVHFMDESIFRALKPHLVRVRAVVWLHGAEVQPWWRRKHNFVSPEAIDHAKRQSAERMRLWREVFETAQTEQNLRFVFVSQAFKDMVFEDYGLSLSPDQALVIHNCIDTDLFSYQAKSADQRKKVLSIRPFASPNYANDLSVQAIQALKDKPFFNELSFHIIGDGPLFEQTVAPLKGFKNVTLEKRFLRQEQIRDLYHQYGLLLIPSRSDTQGVSRDEGMACGMVPLTSAVGAIPEFVDESCAVLAPAEDYLTLSRGIENLYHNPETFLRLSEAAAARVRRQTCHTLTIPQEIALLKGN